MFDQHDDGSHEITLHNVRCPGCEQFPKTSGTLRWAKYMGVQYSLMFDGILSLQGSPFDRGPEPITAGVGRLSSMNLDQPRWLAETDDGTEVSIYGVMDKPTSSTTYGTSGGGVSCGFKGAAMFAVVDIPTSRMLAFDNSTEQDYRLFFIGHAGMRFHRHDRVSFHKADGSVHYTTRSSIRLSESPLVELVAAHALVECKPGGWLAFGEVPTTSDCEMPAFAEQAFISFLNGDKVPFPWADRRIPPRTIRRTYYGWVKARQCDRTEPDHQPLPFLGGIEVFTHGEDVLSRIPSFFQNFIDRSRLFDIGIAMHPLWTALHGVLDDRLALASVSLERTASSWELCRTDVLKDAHRESPIWKRRPLMKALRKALLDRLTAALGAEPRKRRCQCGVLDALIACLNDFLDSDPCRSLDDHAKKELREVMTARINNMTGVPNSARLRQPFDDLQLPLSTGELEALQQRNSALHGRKHDGTSDLASLDLSTQYFDRLRMLVTKFVLKLCGYEGPYIDYASRPPAGNFEVKTLALGESANNMTT
jgi:hypothetical protein